MKYEPEMYITDKDGVRHYYSATKQNRNAAAIGFFVGAAVAALAGLFQIVWLFWVGVIIAVMGVISLCLTVPKFERLKLEVSYRELDQKEAARLAADQGRVFYQRPHGGALDDGTI